MRYGKSKKRTLFSALLWTAVMIIWAISLFLRFPTYGYAESEVVLTVLVLAASGVACAFNWYRYFKYNDKENE